MKVIIRDKTIYADRYLADSNNKSVLFYQTRSDFDYVPPIKVDANMLSDFGEAIFKQVET